MKSELQKQLTDYNNAWVISMFKKFKIPFIVFMSSYLFCSTILASTGLKSGELKLTDYTAKGYITHSVWTTLELVSGQEFIAVKMLEGSNCGNYQLNLRGQKTASISFHTEFKNGVNYDDKNGIVTIVFSNITKKNAHFQITEDNTWYGSGISEDGYMKINF